VVAAPATTAATSPVGGVGNDGPIVQGCRPRTWDLTCPLPAAGGATSTAASGGTKDTFLVMAPRPRLPWPRGTTANLLEGAATSASPEGGTVGAATYASPEGGAVASCSATLAVGAASTVAAVANSMMPVEAVEANIALAIGSSATLALVATSTVAGVANIALAWLGNGLALAWLGLNPGVHC
jgi:hypothetical protein